MTIDLRFTERDWERVARDWTAWWAGELPRPLVVIEELKLPPHIAVSNIHNLGDPASVFPLDMPVDAVLDYYQPRLEAKRFYGDAFPKWFPNFGPGIGAGFLGARVHSTAETVWFEPTAPGDIANLQINYDADNVWWRRVRELTRRAVERWGDRVAIAFTDLGGNLDILASLRGTQELLMELADARDEVLRLTRQITQVWLRYYEELSELIGAAGRGTTPWATIWSPARCYMLQCDLSTMISPQMFARFVLPDLETCCAALDHAFYHLDGAGAVRHLDMLLMLERLRGIQWIPGAGVPPPEEWLPLLKRIRDAGKLCQLYVNPTGARTIARELGGRGFAFYITEQMTAPEAADFLRVMTEG